ncbi:hypothetical protein JCM5296_007401 [Sporobolomyces johnsonii]
MAIPSWWAKFDRVRLRSCFRRDQKLLKRMVTAPDGVHLFASKCTATAHEAPGWTSKKSVECFMLNSNACVTRWDSALALEGIRGDEAGSLAEGEVEAQEAQLVLLKFTSISRSASTSSEYPRTRRSTPPSEPLGPERLKRKNVGKEEEVPAPTRITLRPYQVECITAVLSELRRGEFTRLGVSAPTGSGKTAMFTSLVHHLPPRIHPVTKEHATRVLIIVSSIQLATQTAAVVQRSWPNLLVEIEQGENEASGIADVTVATYQTLGRGKMARLNKFDPDYFKAVIVDEAHHAASSSYLSILSRFNSHVSAPLASSLEASTPAASLISPAPSGVPPASRSASEDSPPCLSDDPPEPVPAELDDEGRMRVPLLGFTATWGRKDRLALGKLFQKIVWHREWLDMIEGKWLSPVQFTTVQLGEALNLADVDVSTKTGDFVAASLAEAVDKREVNELAVKAWIEQASDRRSTLVFAVNISHIYALESAFRERGIDARSVCRWTKPKDRDKLYAAFRAGEFPVLVNCGILTEGADFPEIDCVLLARPTLSQNLFLQMIGRGLRLSPHTGKTDCLLMDLEDNSSMTVDYTPTLFGTDPVKAIGGKTSKELKALSDDAAAAKEEVPFDDLVLDAHSYGQRYTYHYRDYQTAFDFVAINPKERGTFVPIKTLSKLAWVGCPDETWTLELLGNAHVKIVEHMDDFVAYLCVPVPSDSGEQFPGYTARRRIASHSSFPTLLSTTDNYLSNHEEYSQLSLSRDSPWRHDPSTDSQRSIILEKLLSPEEREEGTRTIEGVWVGKPWTKRVEVDELTQGQASDVIWRTKHGGVLRWKRQRGVLVKEEKRREKQRRKEENGEEREMEKREKYTDRTDELLGAIETRWPAKKAEGDGQQ